MDTREGSFVKDGLNKRWLRWAQPKISPLKLSSTPLTRPPIMTHRATHVSRKLQSPPASPDSPPTRKSKLRGNNDDTNEPVLKSQRLSNEVASKTVPPARIVIYDLPTLSLHRRWRKLEPRLTTPTADRQRAEHEICVVIERPHCTDPDKQKKISFDFNPREDVVTIPHVAQREYAIFERRELVGFSHDHRTPADYESELKEFEKQKEKEREERERRLKEREEEERERRLKEREEEERERRLKEREEEERERRLKEREREKGERDRRWREGDIEDSERPKREKERWRESEVEDWERVRGERERRWSERDTEDWKRENVERERKWMQRGREMEEFEREKRERERRWSEREAEEWGREKGERERRWKEREEDWERGGSEGDWGRRQRYSSADDYVREHDARERNRYKPAVPVSQRRTRMDEEEDERLRTRDRRDGRMASSGDHLGRFYRPPATRHISPPLPRAHEYTNRAKPFTSYRKPQPQRHSRAADGPWLHDKFHEVADDEPPIRPKTSNSYVPVWRRDAQEKK